MARQKIFVAVAALSGAVVLAQAPAIRQVASMRVARAAHTATTLRSGQVLIVGGMGNGENAVDSVELFDPARNSIEQISSMAARRAGHTATLLRDGRVLIAGGYNGEYLASIETYDPATRRFRAAGSLHEGRSGHTATLMPDGRVLLTGGVGRGWTFLQSAEIYDPESGGTETVGAMSAPREGHTATLLDDGQVLVAAGHNGRRPNVQLYATAERFDPRTRRFSAAGSLATARHKHDAVKLTDGRVLIIGGADVTDRVHFSTTEIYNSRNDAFERGPMMINPRYKIAGTSIVLPDGAVLVTSGARAAELLDPRSWTFREIAGQYPDAFHFAAAAQVGSDVFVAGGYSDGTTNTSGIWRFAGR